MDDNESDPNELDDGPDDSSPESVSPVSLPDRVDAQTQQEFALERTLEKLGDMILKAVAVPLDSDTCTSILKYLDAGENMDEGAAIEMKALTSLMDTILKKSFGSKAAHLYKNYLISRRVSSRAMKHLSALLTGPFDKSVAHQNKDCRACIVANALAQEVKNGADLVQILVEAESIRNTLETAKKNLPSRCIYGSKNALVFLLLFTSAVSSIKES